MRYESQKPSPQSRRQQELRRKRTRRRRVTFCIFIILSFLLGFVAGKKSNTATDVIRTVDNRATQNKPDSAKESEIMANVAAPKDYSYEEAIAVLTDNAKNDSKYNSILSNPAIYPEGLLTGLANNPEMLSFVAGYSADKSNGNGTITAQEAQEKSPLFLQWDERWGADSYGDNIIAVSGCGPTALSMVIVGLTHNSSASPAQVASFAMDNDYYMFGTGTMWSLMTEGAASYDLSSVPIDVDHNTMKQKLDEGAYLICSMRSGDFTANGHFIVIHGYDASGFLVNDPFCKYRSSIPWTYEQLSPQIKSMWALKKD